MTGHKPRIFVHAPFQGDPATLALKKAVLDEVASLGYSLQEFGVSGVPKALKWNFDLAIRLMQRCDGALVLALGRHEVDVAGVPLRIPSEYAHFEGARTGSDYPRQEGEDALRPGWCDLHCDGSESVQRCQTREAGRADPRSD